MTQAPPLGIHSFGRLDYEVSPPTGVLIRPDGHMAWVGEEGNVHGLADALRRWCGSPAM